VDNAVSLNDAEGNPRKVRRLALLLDVAVDCGEVRATLRS